MIPPKKYGCYQTERSISYTAPNRKYFSDGTYEVRLARVVDTASTDCRYDDKLTDVKCKGCNK